MPSNRPLDWCSKCDGMTEHYDRRGGDGYVRLRCKPCSLEMVRSWYARNPEKNAEYCRRKTEKRRMTA